MCEIVYSPWLRYRVVCRQDSSGLQDTLALASVGKILSRKDNEKLPCIFCLLSNLDPLLRRRASRAGHEAGRCKVTRVGTVARRYRHNVRVGPAFARAMLA